MTHWRELWARRSLVRADAGFWLVLGLMLLLFPLRFLAGVLLAALVHELGHIFAVYLMSGRILGIRLHAGGARIEASPMAPFRTAFCALAGPAFGALTILAWRWFPELALAGLVQTVFNLLPVPPLDGWVLLRCLIPQKRTGILKNVVL